MQPEICIATLLWDPNDLSLEFSRIYDESWVEKLYWGFRRNLTRPFRFVCYTDRVRTFSAPIEMRLLNSDKPGYGDCIQPYELDVPMILVGLDTVIIGNVDHLADHCFAADSIALPRDPYAPKRACNGVALVPAGQRRVFDNWLGENDMEWLRLQPHVFIDDLFPGQVISYKGDARQNGLGQARIVYFHGVPKMQDLTGLDWIEQHWRAAA